MQKWLDCIKTREDPFAPVEAGHRAINLCHFINICRELGRQMNWAPKKETTRPAAAWLPGTWFVGNDEANELIHRARRKCYELPNLA